MTHHSTSTNMKSGSMTTVDTREEEEHRAKRRTKQCQEQRSTTVPEAAAILVFIEISLKSPLCLVTSWLV